MSESEEKITGYLASDETSRFIVSLCINGSTTMNILENVASYYRRKGYGVDYDQIRSHTGNRLKTMEKTKILTYDNSTGRWTATDITKRVLQKYFAL